MLFTESRSKKKKRNCLKLNSEKVGLDLINGKVIHLKKTEQNFEATVSARGLEYDIEDCRQLILSTEVPRSLL